MMTNYYLQKITTGLNKYFKIKNKTKLYYYAIYGQKHQNYRPNENYKITKEN